MMKRIVIVLLMIVAAVSCSQAKIEEIAFRKTLEHDLIDLCGEENKACIDAVKTQTKPCMEKSNWRQYLQNQDDKEELKRFTTEFYACIVDSEGQPYFTPNI